MNSAPQFPSNQLPDRIASLSGTGSLQSAEHLYTLRELMDSSSLDGAHIYIVGHRNISMRSR